ncbi:MAG: ATP-binding cassette domain-containing protein, partial [Treponema sp.]|nr:ATP-binding cassette domain-containing protein [Treponema sp.]
MAYIVAENLVLGYDNTPIASALSFSVNKGDYLCIIGENGSGKTTLIKTLLRLIKPVSGILKIGDGLLSN